jgi:hypothetical protein
VGRGDETRRGKNPADAPDPRERRVLRFSDGALAWPDADCASDGRSGEGSEAGPPTADGRREPPSR